MHEPNEQPAETVTAKIDLSVGGRVLGLTIRVPAGPIHPEELLPLYQQLSNALVEASEQDVINEGKTISCRKGCGACCRQLVPITQMEARHLSRLIEAMPEPRRTAVRERFAEARRRLEEAGLLEPLLQPESLSEEELHEVGRAYLGLRLPCPFLEEESCSIHPDRPLICREYLVTSPPENCAGPVGTPIRKVKIHGRVADAVAEMGGTGSGSRAPWAPLVVAPEWVQGHPDRTPHRTGPEIVTDLFARLSGQARGEGAGGEEEERRNVEGAPG